MKIIRALSMVLVFCCLASQGLAQEEKIAGGYVEADLSSSNNGSLSDMPHSFTAQKQTKTSCPHL